MKKDIVNILVGDSISYGLYDDDFFGWFNRLRLKSKAMQKCFYFNLSIPGQGSNDILNRLELEINSRYSKEDDFNIILAFGIKDVLKLRNNPLYIQHFKKNILKIIKIAKNFTKNVYYLGLLDVDYSIRNEYDINSFITINEQIKMICNAQKIKYLDMSNIISLTDLKDGLHPNSNGHKKICNYVYKELFK